MKCINSSTPNGNKGEKAKAEAPKKKATKAKTRE